MRNRYKQTHKKFARKSDSAGRHTCFLFLLLLSLMITRGCDVDTGNFSLDADGYARSELSNGIHVLMNLDESTALTSARILIGGGVLTETAETSGITNLMVRMLLKGSEKMTGAEISEELDLMGASVAVNCYRDYSTISFTTLSQNFLQVLNIISASILSPTFPQDELTKLTLEVKGEIVSSDDNQSRASSKLFWKTAYGEQSYGLPTLGTESSIAGITSADLREHYNAYVGGKNLLISVATDLDVHQMLVTLEERFGKLKRDAIETQAPILSLQAETDGFIAFERNQSFIYMGFVLDHLPPADVPCLILLNEIMGANVGSRLWYLRQEEKLAYTIYTQYATDKYGALFRAGIGTDTLKVQTALTSLNREWDKLISSGVTESELTDARINMKNNLIYSIDRKSNRANNMAYYHWVGYNYRFVFDLIEMADQVTLVEMNAFIKYRLTDERKYVSIAGKR